MRVRAAVRTEESQGRLAGVGVGAEGWGAHLEQTQRVRQEVGDVPRTAKVGPERGDLLDRGIKPRYPALLADSLTTNPPEKPV